MGGGGVAVYVTSHGFGHLNRTVAVLNLLPDSVPLAIRCHPDLFGHWRERLKRPAEMGSFVSDSGAINPPGDSAATDGRATIEAARRIYDESLAKLDAEADWLRSGGFRVVLADAPPLPLVAAKRAGVPGYLLANFTWAEIYAPHAKILGGDAPKFVAELRKAYRQATLAFRTEPALSMASLAPVPVENVGMVVTPGVDRRAELRERLGLSPGERVVYFYVGRYGQANLEWDRLAAMEKKGLHFVGFHPAPAEMGSFRNLHVVPAAEWTGADLAASADAIVAKAGYGAVCEAMVARTPFVFPTRSGFAEYRALAWALKAWGGSVCVPAKAFERFRIESALDRALSLQPGPPPFPADGAAKIAAKLVEAAQRPSAPGARP